MLEAHYQFLAWLLQTVEKFPKNHKFTLGDRIAITPAWATSSTDAPAVTTTSELRTSSASSSATEQLRRATTKQPETLSLPFTGPSRSTYGLPASGGLPAGGLRSFRRLLESVGIGEQLWLCVVQAQQLGAQRCRKRLGREAAREGHRNDLAAHKRPAASHHLVRRSRPWIRDDHLFDLRRAAQHAKFLKKARRE
jgi:hypothetical protein